MKIIGIELRIQGHHRIAGSFSFQKEFAVVPCDYRLSKFPTLTSSISSISTERCTPILVILRSTFEDKILGCSAMLDNRSSISRGTRDE